MSLETRKQHKLTVKSTAANSNSPSYQYFNIQILIWIFNGYDNMTSLFAISDSSSSNTTSGTRFCPADSGIPLMTWSSTFFFLLTWERQILAFLRVLRLLLLFLVQFLPSRLVLLHRHQHLHLQY